MTVESTEDLERTGERFQPGDLGEIFYEHAHRYRLARTFVTGRRVADLPSGEGYGSSWLAEVATTVVGVDIAPSAVDHARATYGNQSNLRFIAGDLMELPLDEDSVDVVVSFEGIEHVTDPARALAEMDRILAPDGTLVMSTPDRAIYTDVLGIRNDYHPSEMDRTEFLALLGTRFDFVHLLGQRGFEGSMMWALEGSDPDPVGFLAATGGVSDEPARPGDAVYLLALCSRVATPPRPATTIFTDRPDALGVTDAYHAQAVASSEPVELEPLDGTAGVIEAALSAIGRSSIDVDALPATARAWLCEPAVPEDDPVLTRALELLWQGRPDLQAAFPRLDGAWVRAFANWSRSAPPTDNGVPTHFRPPVATEALPVDRVIALLLDDDGAAPSIHDTPTLIAWLAEPVHPRTSPSLSRYLWRLWLERDDLQVAFAGVADGDTAEYLAWAVQYPSDATGVPEALRGTSG